jgi:hypothetical protein
MKKARKAPGIDDFFHQSLQSDELLEQSAAIVMIRHSCRDNKRFS